MNSNVASKSISKFLCELVWVDLMQVLIDLKYTS
jgi:hypothetical protein